MNSAQRIRRTMQGLGTDTLPVAPYMGNHGAAVAGVRLIDYYTQPTTMADAQYAAWEVYGQDMVCIQSDNYYIAEGFGMQADYHENSTPTCRRVALADLSDVAKLKVPDPYTQGRMHVYLEATERIAGKLKDSVIIRSPGTGPFSLAGHLLGVEKLVMHIAEHEYGLADVDIQALHALMEMTTEALLQFSIAQLKAGADIVQCGDSLASLDVISPQIYEKYVYPYEKKFFDAINPIAHSYGAFSLLHICGDNNRVMQLHAETGADMLEVDYKADLKAYKEKIGQRIVLVGNVDPSGVLLQGSVEDVRRACLACIDAAAEKGGFILGSGCEVPMQAPVQNMKEMVRVARAHQNGG
ncbi:MAG: uroporphyrinogen decarboxylase family protein [Eubacteriales bacterium]|nr:uroporphyrinogen decarboxylase family protein [Eubacteriales bacterium]